MIILIRSKPFQNSDEISDGDMDEFLGDVRLGMMEK